MAEGLDWRVTGHDNVVHPSVGVALQDARRIGTTTSRLGQNRLSITLASERVRLLLAIIVVIIIGLVEDRHQGLATGLCRVGGLHIANIVARRLGRRVRGQRVGTRSGHRLNRLVLLEQFTEARLLDLFFVLGLLWMRDDSLRLTA